MNNVFEIRDAALQEAYTYFDLHIRALPKTNNGHFDEGSGGFVDNDVYPSQNKTWSGCLSKSLWSHIRICSRHDLKSMFHFGTGIYPSQNETRIPNDPRKCSKNAAFLFDARYPVIVMEEKKSGKNTRFVDLLTGQIMTTDDFVKAIRHEVYDGYHVAQLGDTFIPKTNPDGLVSNNLG